VLKLSGVGRFSDCILRLHAVVLKVKSATESTKRLEWGIRLLSKPEQSERWTDWCIARNLNDSPSLLAWRSKRTDVQVSERVDKKVGEILTPVSYFESKLDVFAKSTRWRDDTNCIAFELWTGWAKYRRKSTIFANNEYNGFSLWMPIDMLIYITDQW